MGEQIAIPDLRHKPGVVVGQGTSTYRSVAELAEDIGLSERSTRAALRRGEIPHIRIGRRFVLPRAAIAEWLRTAGRKPTRLAVVATPR